MLALLGLPPALGWTLSRYWLRYREWPALLASSAAIALVSTLVGTNFFYLQHPNLGTAVLKTLTIQAIVLLALLSARRTTEPLLPTPRWVSRLLGGLSLLVLVYSNAQQIALTDDDYWIHTAHQGLMRNNYFPPVNPFFSDIPMNGHYGRDLMIVILSYMSGLDVFLSQHLLTSGLQVLTLLLFYAAIKVGEENHKAALLGTVFIFFGINAGGRGGAIDTLQNNNPLVQMYLALLLLLTVTVWTRRAKAAVPIGGIVLGSYAIVYESHFGLVFLTVLAVTPILYAFKRIDKRQALSALLLLVISLPLAFTQGGPLTDLARRREHHAVGQMSKGMQNQAQVVKVKFPKKELFQIFLANGEYQRISNIYRLDTPLKILFKPSAHTGYAYIWSWSVLKIHFLALYLAPWSAFILLRRKSPAGIFLGAFGTIAFLVPALVNFGPIYEAEYYRWEVAAALGFAGALGIALSTLLEQDEPRPIALSGSQVVVKPAGKRYLLVAAITAINSLASLNLVFGRLAESASWNLKEWLIFPSTKEWIEEHPILAFTHLDFETANWLKEQVQPGDCVLADSPEENNFSILFDATLTGITGARAVGHALPLEDEEAATTPYRLSPAAKLFWQTKRPDPLAQLNVDWLFMRGQVGDSPPKIPACQLLKTFKMGDQERYIYRVDKAKLPSFSVTGTGSSLEEPVPTKIESLPHDMRGGRVYRYALEALLRPNQEVDGVVLTSTKRRSDGLLSHPSEDLELRVSGRADRSGHLSLQLPFVAPYDEGTYDLYARYTVEGAGPIMEAQAEFRSDFQEGLKGIKLEKLVIPDVLPADTILTPTATLSLPGDLPRPREVLACWSFYNQEKAEFDQLPGAVLTRVSLSKELTNLPMVTPHRPGTYRLSLYLSGGQGHLVRVLGRNVTVVGGSK